MDSEPSPEIKRLSLSDEAWREYRFGETIHRIADPCWLYTRPGGTTHRVLDAAGLVHCCPAPGHFGCVLVWKPRDPDKPVQF
jgi:hypothetical protein